MKAGYIENHGSVENIKIGDVDTPKIGNLDVKRDFTDVRDVVKAYSLLIEK